MSPLQDLVLDVLVARYRLGDRLWTMSGASVVRAARKLQRSGLVNVTGGISSPSEIRVSLTDDALVDVELGLFDPSSTVRYRPELEPAIQSLGLAGHLDPRSRLAAHASLLTTDGTGWSGAADLEDPRRAVLHHEDEESSMHFIFSPDGRTYDVKWTSDLGVLRHRQMPLGAFAGEVLLTQEETYDRRWMWDFRGR